MLAISINEPEMGFIDLFRLALSGETKEQRESAIKNVKHEVVASLNRPGFTGDQLLHFTRPYRARRAVHRSSLPPRLGGCS